MRKLLSLAAVLIAAISFHGICLAEENKTIKEFSDVVTIAPEALHEKCVILRPGQAFDYKFESSSPVYFNIHYHGEHGREYMTQKKAVSGHQDTITEVAYRRAYKAYSKKATLCMLWKNNTDEPVKLSLDCTTLKR